MANVLGPDQFLLHPFVFLTSSWRCYELAQHDLIPDLIHTCAGEYHNMLVLGCSQTWFLHSLTPNAS